DTVPANTTFAGSTPASTCSPGDAAGTECGWALEDVGPGKSTTLELALTLGAGSYQLTNAATATADGAPEASDADDSLHRAVDGAGTGGLDDTYVAEADAPNVNHGLCNRLRVARDDPATPADERSTAFFRTFLDFLQGVEQVWHAQVRATVTADVAPVATDIAAHAVADRWIEGTGSCAGGAETGNAPRKGWTPAFAATPTALAGVTGAPGQALTWDVTSDVDSPADRAATKGWALVDHGTGPGGAATVLQATEAGTAERANFAMVYTVREEPACVDSDPDAVAAEADRPAALSATLTDGTRVVSGELDACNGAPVAGERVEWQIEDDDPDAHLSREEGSPGLNANLAVSQADGSGVARIALVLADPSGPPGPAGESVVAARVFDAPDPAGEADHEDDVTVGWTRVPRPGTAPPPGTTGTGTEQQPPTATAPAARTVSAAPTRRARYGAPLAIAGRVESSDRACVADQRVVVARRVRGTLVPVAAQHTDATGAFRLHLVARRAGEHVATVAASPACAAATSAAWSLRPAAVITVTRRRGRLTGTVRPRLPGRTVVLQRRTARPRGEREERGGGARRTARRWVTVARTKLDRRSRFRFPNRAGRLRVHLSRRQAPGHAPASSRTVVLRRA
ncbi:MAG TPA: hypothetical protein VGW75_00800, partial [Solirubrobacteraceae bacterium]|nr:hypothetical protein [Solirubrobacteraceae bacterium]